jgi:hypothetical protein
VLLRVASHAHNIEPHATCTSSTLHHQRAGRSSAWLHGTTSGLNHPRQHQTILTASTTIQSYTHELEITTVDNLTLHISSLISNNPRESSNTASHNRLVQPHCTTFRIDSDLSPHRPNPRCPASFEPHMPVTTTPSGCAARRTNTYVFPARRTASLTSCTPTETDVSETAHRANDGNAVRTADSTRRVARDTPPCARPGVGGRSRWSSVEDRLRRRKVSAVYESESL